jgi:hypothetical protein
MLSPDSPLILSLSKDERVAHDPSVDHSRFAFESSWHTSGAQALSYAP